jgi:predicted N-acetyltransferase YhbS
MKMRLLTRDEVELIWTIDRSEVHHHTYELREGQLVRTPNYFEIPGWRADAAEKVTPVLLDCLDRGGTFLGVFDAEALVGMSVLESARVGRAGDQMQLAYLYVSRAYRGRGVGRQLFEAAVSCAREAGGTRSTYLPHPPRTPSTSISIEAAYSRLSPTRDSWRRSPTTSISAICSDARGHPSLRMRRL